MVNFFRNLIIIYLIVIANFSYSACIVFIHDGPFSIPDYSYFALKQAAYFNQDSNIYVLVNEKSQEKLSNWKLDKNIKIIQIKNIQISDLTNKFQSKYKYKKSSNLIWYATKRFFTLYDFSETYKLNDIFLMEYDNLIYEDINILSEILRRKNYNIGVTSLSDKFVICGLSFFKNANGVKKICSEIYNNWNQKESEMSLLATIKKLFPNEILDLPVASTEQVKLQGYVENNNFIPNNNFESFNSIFDHAAYGQYLDGTHCDPPGFINDAAQINPALCKLVWKKDKNNKIAPFIQDSANFETYYKLNNIHVHSKRLKKFSTFRVAPALFPNSKTSTTF